MTLMILFSAFCELLCLPAITPLVDAVSDVNKLYDNRIYRIGARFIHMDNIVECIIFSITVIIFVYVFKNVIVLLLYRIQYNFVYEGQKELSARLVKQYVNRDYFFHKCHNVAELQRDVNEDVSYFYASVLSFIQMFTEAVVCTALAVYLLIQDLMVTMFTVVFLALILLLILIKYKRSLAELGSRTRDALAERNKWVLQLFGAIKDVKVFSREEYFFVRYCRENGEYNNVVKRQQYLTNVPKPLIEMCAICALMSGLIIKLKISNDPVTVLGIIAVFVAAAFRLLPSFSRISSCLTTLSYFSKSIDAVHAHVSENTSANVARKKSEDIYYSNGDIEFSSISYTYPDDSEAVIDGVDLTIRKNESVAFIGPSGAGKTTLVDILLGIYVPDKGDILFGGKSIYGDIVSWHSFVGYIPQTIYLLDDTIKANIAFGIEDDEIDEDKLELAIRKAQLEEFISTLDDGMDTVIGESGVRLSGGQRQRIGIARALYNDPPVLVLDEATSSLDNDTEKAVMDAINDLQGDKTLIIIAHRLSTVKNCDSIYEVKDKIVRPVSEEERIKLSII